MSLDRPVARTVAGQRRPDDDAGSGRRQCGDRCRQPGGSGQQRDGVPAYQSARHATLRRWQSRWHRTMRHRCRGNDGDRQHLLSGGLRRVERCHRSAASGGGSAPRRRRTDRVVHQDQASATTSVAIITYKGPDQGRVAVTIDGAAATTIDLYAATPAYRTVITFPSPSATGTPSRSPCWHAANPASTGTQFRLDAIKHGNTTFEDTSGKHPLRSMDSPATRTLREAVTVRRACRRALRSTPSAPCSP